MGEWYEAGQYPYAASSPQGIVPPQWERGWLSCRQRRAAMPNLPARHTPPRTNGTSSKGGYNRGLEKRLPLEPPPNTVLWRRADVRKIRHAGPPTQSLDKVLRDTGCGCGGPDAETMTGVCARDASAREEIQEIKIHLSWRQRGTITPNKQGSSGVTPQR